MNEKFTIVSRKLIDGTLRNYVCSKCWGNLGSHRNADASYKVFCKNENCDGVGFHKRSYAEKTLNENKVDAKEAKDNLRNVMPGLFPEMNLTEDEMIKFLGY